MYSLASPSLHFQLDLDLCNFIGKEVMDQMGSYFWILTLEIGLQLYISTLNDDLRTLILQ